MKEFSNEESHRATVLQTPFIMRSLRKPKHSTFKAAKTESRRVIPGRLDAMYKTLGVKRLTPRKNHTHSMMSRRTLSNARWTSTKSTNSRYRDRVLPACRTRARPKYLPTVPKYPGSKKRFRAERLSCSSFQEKKKRALNRSRSKRPKDLLDIIRRKSADSFKSDAPSGEYVKTPCRATKRAFPSVVGEISVKEEPNTTTMKAAVMCVTGENEKREQQELSRQLNTQIKDLTSKIKDLTTQIQDLSSQSESFQSENSTLQATIRSQKSAIESLQLSLTGQQTKMEPLRASVASGITELKAKQTQCDDISQRCEMLEKKNNLLRTKLTEVEKSNTSFTINDLSRLDSLVDKIPDFSGLRIRLPK